MKKLILAPVLAAAALFALAPWATGAPLSKAEANRLMGELMMAIKNAQMQEKLARKFRSEGDEDQANEAEGQAYTEWGKLEDLIGELAAANNKKAWKIMVKAAEQGPPRLALHEPLCAAIATMDDSGVQKAARKTALKSKSRHIRRGLVLHFANKEDWDLLLDAIYDRDEQCASLAAWRLVDGRVEDAVVPLIKLMTKLEKNKAGIWDVCRNGLGKLLGQRCESAIEYESLWELVQSRGGLSSVQPKEQPKEEKPAGEIRSVSVRLFGRNIDCTRVVFILDVSGSMEQIDPNYVEYDDEPSTSRTRDPAESETHKKKPKGKTRLQRAQRQLKRVIKHLPGNFKINIVAYSSRVQLWRGSDGDAPPSLHELTDKNRKAACEFVDAFKASGVTATDSSLMRAYEVEGARCFYLLSDGFATHDGTTQVPTDVILGIPEDFKDRHVTIHTLGFNGADVEMMQALANATGGEYSDIR